MSLGPKCHRVDRDDLVMSILLRKDGRVLKRRFERSRSSDARSYAGVLFGDEECFHGGGKMNPAPRLRVGWARIGL